MELKNVDLNSLQDELSETEGEIIYYEEKLEEAYSKKNDIEAEIEKFEGEE